MMHTAKSYRAEWAVLTGRSEREVYVPEALRPVEPLTFEEGELAEVILSDIQAALNRRD